MDRSRRRLLRSVGATAAAVAVAGCSLRDRGCPSAADSLSTTVGDEDRSDLGLLDGAWPMQHRDAAATGYAAAPGPRDDVERRRIVTGSGRFFPSVVVGADLCYVTSRHRNLLAIDPVDGSLEWRYDGLDAGGGRGALADDLVLVAARNGLHAVDAATGDPRWHLDSASFPGDGTLLVADGRAYVDTWDGVLAVDLAAGEPDWHVDGERLGAVADGRAYVGGGTGLHAVDAADGTELWHADQAGSDGAVAVRDGTVYVGGGAEWGHLRDDPGRLHALAAADGTEQWVFTSEETETFQSPTVGPGAVALGSHGGGLSVLDREDGSRRWCVDFPQRSLAAPVIGDDVVYALAADVVQARRLDDGEPRWTTRVDDEERLDRDVNEFYHHQALAGDVLLVTGYGRDGVVLDALLER